MPRIRLSALPALLLIACGDDAPTEPDRGLPDRRPAFAISDAVHQGGVPQFYWLPPTVPNPGPAVTGTFDDGLLGGPGVYPQLEVRICPAGVTTLCPASGTGSFQSFNGYGTSSGISVQQAGNYQLLWNKNELGSGNTYRAWVLVQPAASSSPVTLGFADVKVVANSQALKQLDAGQFVGLVAGSPLYLKFTVRTGIPEAVSVALGSSTLASGGSTTATATVTDLHGVVLPGEVVTWAVTPSGSPPGSVTPTTSTTSSAGTATTTLTAGNGAGNGAVTATVGKPPAQLTGSAGFTVGSGSLLQESLVSGDAHTCGLTTTGAAYCWGYNEVGQVGDNSALDRHAPVAVVLPSGVTGFTSLTGDGGHNCGLTSTGAAYCWGYNITGQLGDNSTIDRYAPVAVSLPSGVTGFASLTAGAFHTCGLTDAGAAYCWGWNGHGQLGNNSNTDNSTPVAVDLPFGVAGFATLTADDHTCALTSAGDAYCWGQGAAGQLGNNQTVASFTPDAVILPGGVTGFASLAAGGSHTCGLTTTGAAYCWGLNTAGQLGDNSTVSVTTPVAVSLPSEVPGFARLTAGGAHACGLTSAGAAYCWGWNFRGQVGDNSTTDRLTPEPVSGGLTFQTP